MRKEDVKLIDFTALGIDTKLFSPAAEYFKKHKKYHNFNDNDYWDEEQRRCIEGYTITGTKGISITITGEHYQYINYCNIKQTEDPDRGKKKVYFKKAVTKGHTFPAFWDGDYIFYWCKLIARFGASNHPEIKKQGGLTLEEFENLHFPDEIKIRKSTFIINGKEQDFFQEEDDNGNLLETKYVVYGSGKNLCVGKKRRGGYSYKMGNAGSRRYHFFKKSTTLLCAYDNAYLLDDALMTKTIECIDWVDGNTPFTKRRLINADDHKKSGYKDRINGTETEKGKLSQVIALSFRANKGAARGKDADEIYVEESGKAPNILDFTTATLDSLSDGLMNSTGQIIWFGTGGGDATDWEGFKEIFYNPKKYNALEFENTWDEDGLGTYCGMFIPDYWTSVGFITENGESLIELAKEAELEYQKYTFILKNDSKGLTERKMEHPFSPVEAFNVISDNLFDIEAIRTWKNYLKNSGLYKDLGTVGQLVRQEDGKLKFEINNNLMPIYEYPPPKGVTKGAVVIWDSPRKVDSRIPNNLYIIDVDGYRHDQTTGDSVGAIYVSININNVTHANLGDKLVASYIARPKSQDDFNKVLYDLAEYYNAKIAFENDEPAGIVDYGKRFKKLDRLESQFELAYDETLKTSNTMKRGYGMHMGSGKNNDRIITGDGYIKDYLETPRSVDEDEKLTLNLHTIYDIGLLEELERYNPNKGNFDRVAAFRIRMYHSKEMLYKNKQVMIKKKEEGKINFFKHQFYK